MPLYQGLRNGVLVEKPYPVLDAVQDWTLDGAGPSDELTIDGYPDDGRVPMLNWRYDWEVKSWLKTN